MADGNSNGGKENESSFNSMWRLGAVSPQREYPVYGSEEWRGKKIIAEDQIRNLNIGEDDPNLEREAYERTNFTMNEERARMDAELQRMTNAEFPADIAPMLEAIRLNMNTDIEPAVDKYSRDLSIAFKRSRIFSGKIR